MNRTYCNKNTEKFKRCLSFVYESEDVQADFSRTQGVIDVHFDTNFKLHTFTRTYSNRHPWMTEAVRAQIKLNNSIHKDYLYSNNIELLKSYRDTKRMLHSSLRKAEIKYLIVRLKLNSNGFFKTKD